MSALNNSNIKNALEANLERKMNTGYVENEGQLLGKAPLAHRNPLDRNGDGRVDFQDLSSSGLRNETFLQGNTLNQGMGYGQTSYVQSAQRSSLGLVRSEPTIREVVQKDVVIHERIHPVQKEEIQPIIYREREQLDVKQITQMMHETQVRPTVLEQHELPAERREAIIERAAPITANVILPSSQVDVTTRTQVMHAPIINEVIKKTIVEEIQPVLERDVYQSTVIQNTQPIFEKIIEAPIVTRETRLSQGYSQGVVMNELQGQRLSGNYNELAGNRRLSQTYVQPIYNEPMLQNRRLSQNYNEPLLQNNGLAGEALLTNRGLQGVGSQNIPLSQGQGLYNEPMLQNRRLSQNYNEPLLQSGLQQPMYNEPMMQNRRLSQNYGLQQPMGQWGVNNGPAPVAGMNGTGIGMASSIPTGNMTRGFNSSGVYAEGFTSNNNIMSAGLTGNYSAAGSVASNVGTVMPRGVGMMPVSVMEQNMLNNNRLSQTILPQQEMIQGQKRFTNSNSAYGLEPTLQQEKLREMERQDMMLRQQQPIGINRM